MDMHKYKQVRMLHSLIILRILTKAHLPGKYCPIHSLLLLIIL